MNPLISDEQMLESYLSGDQSVSRSELLNELFARHQKKVALWCLRVTGDRQDALDLAQEVFIKVMENLHSFRGGSRFTTWLYTITRNHCLNHLKSISRRPPESDPDSLVMIEDTDSTAVFDRINEEGMKERMLEMVYQVLDETEAKVMTLHYAEEMPLPTVTRLLALENPSGAKAYIVSARRKLTHAIRRWKAKQAPFEDDPIQPAKRG